jgi:hypothetical protein
MLTQQVASGLRLKTKQGQRIGGIDNNEYVD